MNAAMKILGLAERQFGRVERRAVMVPHAGGAIVGHQVQVSAPAVGHGLFLSWRLPKGRYHAQGDRACGHLDGRSR
jgi:hypothetical protein